LDEDIFTTNDKIVNSRSDKNLFNKDKDGRAWICPLFSNIMPEFPSNKVHIEISQKQAFRFDWELSSF